MRLPLFLVALGITLTSGVPGVLSAEEPLKKGAERFQISTRKKDDSVTIQVEKKRAIFTVTSPSGISQAIITRGEERWPESVIVQLRLKGLEHFRASNGTLTLEGAVSSQDGKPRVRLWKDGKEDAPLDPKSPFWAEIRLLDKEGKPTSGIPLKEGVIEITLPRAFFASNPRTITLNWIDFYRG